MSTVTLVPHATKIAVRFGLPPSLSFENHYSSPCQPSSESVLEFKIIFRRGSNRGEKSQ